jgi:hypothetical protein
MYIVNNVAFRCNTWIHINGLICVFNKQPISYQFRVVTATFQVASLNQLCTLLMAFQRTIFIQVNMMMMCMHNIVSDKMVYVLISGLNSGVWIP